MLYSFTEYLWMFFIYSFLGWCSEVVFAAAHSGKFVNRGFLTGPVCPIYGVGIVAVIGLLMPIKHNLILFYICAVIVTSVIELIIGFVSHKLLHERLWDYSKRPFNIGGYICLEFSLLWGICCICVVYAVHPLIYHFISIIPNLLGTILLIAFGAVFLADIIITVIEALKIESRMKAINDISRMLETVSYDIGEKLSEGVSTVKEKAPEKEKELKEKYKTLLEKRNYIHKRLFKAFPNLQNGKYKSAFSKIQKYREEKNKSKSKK